MSITIQDLNDKSLEVTAIDIPKYHLGDKINPNVPIHPTNCYLVASCGKGKTNLIVWLLHTHYKQFFNSIYIFSGTIHQDIWKTMKLDYDKCFETYSDELFLRVMEDIKAHPDDKTLIIIDDMSGGTAYSKKNSPLAQFLTNHRHFPSPRSGTSIFLVSHAFKSVPKLIRSVIDDLIVFETSSADELEVIVNDNRGRLTKDQFLNQIYDKVEEGNYNFLYIKRKEPFATRFRINFTKILKLDMKQLIAEQGNKKNKNIKLINNKDDPENDIIKNISK